MKRTEYSFGKIDFNGSRAVIPTERARESKDSLAFFFVLQLLCRLIMLVVIYQKVEVLAVNGDIQDDILGLYLLDADKALVL